MLLVEVHHEAQVIVPLRDDPIIPRRWKIEIPFQGEPYRRNPANTKMLRFRVLPSG